VNLEADKFHVISSYKVYLANIRLKGVETDILLTVYEPLVIRYWC
jgi:hypothetical protein